MEGTGQSATRGTNDGINEAIELGATLKEMRLALKRDLDDVADELRIRRSYLEAIEEGRFTDLPGTTYALGFVRAYAETLGFDASDAARRFKSAVGGGTPQPNLVLPAPVPSGGLPTGAVLLAAATLAVLVYGGWYVLTTEGHDPGAMVSSLSGKVAGVVRSAIPERAAEPTETPPRVAFTPPPATAPQLPRAPSGESTPAAPGEPDSTASAGATLSAPAAPDSRSSAPTTQVPSSTTTATTDEADQDIDEDEDTPPPPPEQVVNEPPPPLPTATTPKPLSSSAAAPKPIPAAPPSPAPNPSSPQQAALPASPPAAAAPASSAHRIVLVAHADSWVELRDESGASIYSRVLRKDERYEVPERQGLVMMTGNAGGVEVLVDGRAAPALGTSGAVKRNIVMDPDKLLAGTAVPPPPPPQPATPTP